MNLVAFCIKFSNTSNYGNQKRTVFGQMSNYTTTGFILLKNFCVIFLLDISTCNAQTWVKDILIAQTE